VTARADPIRPEVGPAAEPRGPVLACQVRAADPEPAPGTVDFEDRNLRTLKPRNPAASEKGSPSPASLCHHAAERMKSSSQTGTSITYSIRGGQLELNTGWSTRSFEIKVGRDPLGLQTITTDRIMPALTPGVLALSQRARYFSFHLFLLEEYKRRRQPANRQALSDFIRRFEYDLAVAIELCPGCGETGGIGSVGRNSVRGVRDSSGPYDRAFSVESSLGGYGLYYRTPMATMGLVHLDGSTFGEDEVLPVDVIDKGLGERIADAFRVSIEDTAYYRQHMYSPQPVPRDVLVEYSSRACLCQLAESPAEQRLLREAFFEDRPPSVPWADAAQRRRVFALWIDLAKRNATIVDDESAFRREIWEWFAEGGTTSTEQADALAEWAALVARETMQEGWSSVWSDLCRSAIAEQGAYGIDAPTLDLLIDEMVAQPVDLPNGQTFSIDPGQSPDRSLAEIAAACADVTIEELRIWAAKTDSLTSGLVTMLATLARLPNPGSAPEGWRRIGGQDGASQPGLLRLVGVVQDLLRSSSSIAEFTRRFVHRLIIVPHERIAYGKLPEFTFRFKWADGRLRFFRDTLRDADSNPPSDHFGPSDIRHAALGWLAFDLGLYEWDGESVYVTSEGSALVKRTFG